MTPLDLYIVAGAALFMAGLHALLVRAHLFWKVLAVNVMAGGVFLLLIAVPSRLVPGRPDPVPSAMVLTGIVVALASTALALGLSLRVAARTGRARLDEELPRRGRAGAGREEGTGEEEREGAGPPQSRGEEEREDAGREEGR